jgi:hypothetical protein
MKERRERMETKMMKIILLLYLISLFSCSKDRDNNFELTDEIISYINGIEKIYMYNIDRSSRFIYGDIEEWPLYTEEDIRDNGNLFIFYNNNSSNQLGIIAVLLYSAKKIDIDPKKNVVQMIWKDGLYWTKDSGCVVDIYDFNGDIIKTYIMQNGLDVFYEKGKENIFYEMPKTLLDKYVIYEHEFIPEYNKNMR